MRPRITSILLGVLMLWGGSAWANLIQFDLKGYNARGGGLTVIHDNRRGNGSGRILWNFVDTIDPLTLLFSDDDNDGMLDPGETFKSLGAGTFQFRRIGQSRTRDLVLDNFSMTVSGPHGRGGYTVRDTQFDWHFGRWSGTTILADNFLSGRFNRVLIDRNDVLRTELWGALESKGKYGKKFKKGIDLGLYDPYDSTPVPEPSTVALLGLGLAGIAVVRRRRKRLN